MAGELVRYDAMCQAIAAAYSVDEVKDIHDRAVALEHYARQAKNTEMVRQCAEIRVRAERKTGELLAQMNKAKGAREPGTNRGATLSEAPTASKTLGDLGISRDQSSQWQRLAEMPEDQFEAAIANAPIATTEGLLRAARRSAGDRDPPPLKFGPHADCVQLETLRRRWDDHAVAGAIQQLMLAAWGAPDIPSEYDDSADEPCRHTIMQLERWAAIVKEEGKG